MVINVEHMLKDLKPKFADGYQFDILLDYILGCVYDEYVQTHMGGTYIKEIDKIAKITGYATWALEQRAETVYMNA